MQDTFSGRIKAADQDFIQYTIKNIETRYTLEKIGYSVYYNSLKYMDTFKKFVKKETDSDILPMKNLTGELIVSYIDYRKTERNNSSQSINKTLTPLIQAAKKAASDELIKPAIATTIEGMYLDTKSKSVDDEEKSEDEKVRYLTEDQIKSFLELYPIVKYDRTREYMDMFLFAFHACGLRVSDIITLTWKNINFEERILKKTLVKGRVSHSFLLTDAALKILEEWKKKSYSERFVFGLLPDDFELSNEAELKRLTTNKNTAIKTSLKEIGKKMNLKFSLTMHTARHTFAVMALNQRKVSVHIISKLLAHANTSVTETVYAKFLPSTIDEEIKSKLVFDFLPSSMKDN